MIAKQRKNKTKQNLKQKKYIFYEEGYYDQIHLGKAKVNNIKYISISLLKNAIDNFLHTTLFLHRI